MAVEFVADKKARRFFNPKTAVHRIVAKKANELGVLTRPLPFVEVNSFSPPLCITKAEVDEGVDRYARALEAVTPELRELANR
jgi:L-2,4-diaminobutyrate transaminase